MVGHQVPELVPQLSRGKHRSPRKGACFMEMASYLAGERWSDHPACTHPLLGALARLVNDHTTDAGRGSLVELVPSVIGLTNDDPHVDVQLMLRSATTALPAVSAARQRMMAVSILAAEQVLSGLDGRPPGELDGRSERALAQVPHATRWARHFARELGTTAKGVLRYGAPNTVRHAVVGIRGLRTGSGWVAARSARGCHRRLPGVGRPGPPVPGHRHLRSPHCPCLQLDGVGHALGGKRAGHGLTERGP